MNASSGLSKYYPIPSREFVSYALRVLSLSEKFSLSESSLSLRSSLSLSLRAPPSSEIQNWQAKTVSNIDYLLILGYFL